MRGDLGAGVLSMMVRAPHGELTRQKNNVPTIPARSRAAEGTWAAPAPGTSLGMGIGKNRDRPGHGPMGVPGAAGLMPGLHPAGSMARQSHAVGNWRLALLWHHCGRGCWTRRAGVGIFDVGRMRGGLGAGVLSVMVRAGGALGDSEYCYRRSSNS